MTKNRNTKKYMLAKSVNTKRYNSMLHCQPPDFKPNIVITKKFRFMVSDGTYQSVSGPLTLTPAKLGALVIMGTVLNTTGTQFFCMVKVRNICIWSNAASPTNSGANTTVGIAYSGVAAGVEGPNVMKTASSLGGAEPLFLSHAPPPESQASQWQTTNNTGVGILPYISIVVPAFAVIDVTLDLAVPFATRTTLNTVPLANIAVGEIAYLALDNPCGGVGSGGNLVVPQATLHTAI